MARRFKLSAALSFDYSLIGIVTQLKDYKLCHFLNENLGLGLTRHPNLPVLISEQEPAYEFPFFRFYEPHHKINWYLIANKNHQQRMMLPELRQIDFFLINDGLPDFVSLNKFIADVNKITNVQLAQSIPLNKPKGLIPVLQDLELHILELDRKNKSGDSFKEA